MGRLIDRTGHVFGRLTVVASGLCRRTAGGRAIATWVCRCECGQTATVDAQALQGGHTRSCGCLHAEAASRRASERLAKGPMALKHGCSKRNASGETKEYVTWRAMKARCGAPSNTAWHKYGGAGVRVAPEWSASFEAFLDDMGPRPDGCSLDRINPHLGYEPANCRWATAAEQARNQRRHWAAKAA